MPDQTWTLEGTERCLLCDFQGRFVYTGGPEDLQVGATWTENCIKCGFHTTHVLEAVEVPSEDLDTLCMDLDPMEPLPDERPMMNWWYTPPQEAESA